MTTEEIADELVRLTDSTRERIRKHVRRAAVEDAKAFAQPLRELEAVIDSLYFGDPVDDRAVRAAQAAIDRLYEAVAALPQGVDTTVSELHFDRLNALSVDLRLETAPRG